MAWGARNLISTQASARHVVEYLELVDPPASRTADELYGFLAASEDEYSKACLEDARLDARGAARRVDATRDGCERVLACVEINQCVGCTRQFFTKSFLGDDAAALARSSGEEPASPRHRAGVASMAWRSTR